MMETDFIKTFQSRIIQSLRKIALTLVQFSFFASIEKIN
jgi:hypothetical protein